MFHINENAMVIRMMGGLGNQMYQYAYGCYFEKMGIKVKHNLQWFNDNKDRKFILNLFGCQLNMTLESWSESGDHGKYHYLKYTDPVKERLIREFTLDKELRLSKNSVGIHVRRGDYVDHPRFPNLTMDYYNEALSIVRGDTHYVFSDDIPWCREKFPERFVFIDYPDYICFDMLKRCNHKIIANSTFSWWAAYLGGGSVVAPSRWFHDPAKQSRAINQLPRAWQII